MAGSIPKPFEVVPYDPDGLPHLLHHPGYNSPITIKDKDHVKYFKDYFSDTDGLNAKYVVKEFNYINRDYLHDYANYYSLCFQDYLKVCTRLHFFTGDHGDTTAFKEKFESIILEGSDNHKTFWDENYLGFIVIKPTPYSVVGFTLLKHFNFNKENKLTFDSNRDYWGVKNYPVHIFGNQVTIESLAFQEQDQALAACATIAIWCMLQRAAEDYFVILKSPGEITNDTGIIGYKGNRLFPNKGLIVPDMCSAITKNGLVTEVRHKNETAEGEFNMYLRKLINAYSQVKIPILLGLDVPYKNELVGHAVAICGHRLEPYSAPPEKSLLTKLFGSTSPQKNINWVADRMNKFYVHDDQWGPFSKMEFGNNDELISSWTRFSKINLPSKPIAVIIPVYPKIRISYDDIESIVLGFNKILIKMLEDELDNPSNIFWDIKLFLSEDYKIKIQKLELFDKESTGEKKFKLKFLSTNLPKYIWVASFIIKDNDIVDFIFDATGLASGMLGLAIINYIPSFQNQLQEQLDKKRSQIKSLIEEEELPNEEYIDFLKNEMSTFNYN